MTFILSLVFATLSPVLHGPRSEPSVALTFDACPTSKTDGYDEAVVQVLLDHRVPATVFLAGKWVEKHKKEARLLARHFEIGNHGYAHNDALQPHLSYADASKDIGRAQNIIRKVTGKQPKYYRPPGELYNPEVLQAAHDHGLTTVLHDVASGDPDPNLEADRIVRYVTWKTKPGSIVIFHLNGRGWTTAKTLPSIIENLTSKGLRFVTVNQLLDEESE